jgi:hypothetical protein
MTLFSTMETCPASALHWGCLTALVGCWERGGEVPTNSASGTVGVSTAGVPGPTSKLSLRVPAQMGRREMEHKGEQKREPRLVLSCAQGGCTCSRGLQAFARERERERLSISPSSHAATFPYEGPGPSIYRCKEKAQMYNGGVAMC